MYDEDDDDEEEKPTRYDGRKATVDGHTFDIPSWLTEGDFMKALHDRDDDNPLSSLVSLEHIEGSDDDEQSGESYHAAFLIPEGCSRRLCFPDDVFSERHTPQDIEHEITPEGLLLRFDVSAPPMVDSDIHAHFYRDDEDGIASLLAGVHDLDEDSDCCSLVKEQLDRMKPGECAEIRDWDGYIDRKHTSHGDFIAVVSVLED